MTRVSAASTVVVPSLTTSTSSIWPPSTVQVAPLPIVIVPGPETPPLSRSSVPVTAVASASVREPYTVRVPATADCWAPHNVSELSISRLPLSVRPETLSSSPSETSTGSLLPPAGMHAQSDAPGTCEELQLPGSSQSELSAPVQESVQAGAAATVRENFCVTSLAVKVRG